MATWERFPAVKFEVKEYREQEDRWTFKGYASIFNTSDRIKDVVVPGAFKRTIDHHKGNFPLCWMHNREKMVGGVKVREDIKGLFVDNGFLLKVLPLAQDVHHLMKADVVDGMSFSYNIKRRSFDGDKRVLEELQIGEVTLGPRSMICHPDALVTEKLLSDDEQKVLDDFNQWIENQKEVQKLNDVRRVFDQATAEVKELFAGFKNT